MKAPTTDLRYEIRVNGQLPEAWSEWFERLDVFNEPGDGAVLRGSIVDQAALIGLLTKIHSLNLQITSVRRIQSYPEGRPSDGMGTAGESPMSRDEVIRYVAETRIAYLASVDRDGAPRVRPMGVSTVYGESIYFFTFAMTAKVSELEANPRVEVVWSKPDDRSQVRVQGRVARERDDAIVRRFREDNPIVDRMIPPEARDLFRLYRITPECVRVAPGFVPYSEVSWNADCDAKHDGGTDLEHNRKET